MERTSVDFNVDFNKIKDDESLVFLGSCFAQSIGNEFLKHHFNVEINPFGVVFHPIPLIRLIQRCITNSEFSGADFFLHDNYYFTYDSSGVVAKTNLQDTIKCANQQLFVLRNALGKAKKLFITLGSAVEYNLEGKIVANCHKQPQYIFSKKVTDLNFLSDELNVLVDQLKVFNPNLEIVFTVSPVRHKKEGLVTDRLSKSTLIVGAQQVAAKNKKVSYLPVYEFFTDELRDYSFVKEDLVRPNDRAIGLIWAKVQEYVLSERAVQKVKSWRKIQGAIDHKLIYPQSNATLVFLTNLKMSLISFQKTWNVSLMAEIQKVESRINSLEQ